jgi:hypothetical protein
MKKSRAFYPYLLIAQNASKQKCPSVDRMSTQERKEIFGANNKCRACCLPVKLAARFIGK